ncbi:SpoIIE family protein phosphatase [Streptomyces sp. NPDC047108]|uniref:PP2C family protein-serine/threonine phosphatase n=1 Tax=Streptomyces sp. NPDC047108 TaxID=3155025 RepID=UPI0033E5A997
MTHPDDQLPEPESAAKGAESGPELGRRPDLQEDPAEELYEYAPCGFLSTDRDWRIVKVNATLLNWLGYDRAELVHRRRFPDLLTVGGKLYHETHYAPLLRLQGRISGVALELRRADGTRLPVLATSVLKTDAEGRPLLVRTTLFEALDRRGYEQELLRARHEAEQERERLVRLVSTLQSSLLPPALPPVPGLESATHYRNASTDQVGGDFYDLFPLSSGRWGFFLGDVSGKGPSAATLTSLIRYTLRAAAVYAPGGVSVLDHLNTVLHREDPGDDSARHCTVIYGELTRDGPGFRVDLASGGHPPALLLRADGTAAYQFTHGGMLVGALPAAEFSTAHLRLAPGDCLLLYTDGLTEARTDQRGGRYGDEALLSFGAGLAPACASDAIAAVSDLLTGFGSGLQDDSAVLALSVPP